jgi:Ran GTPase-activating protein (RanGAP) involved in mRNA processing and transport
MEELSHGFEGVTKKKGKVENFATTGTVLASAQESVLSTIVACLGPPLEQSWFLLETTRCLRVALEQGQTRAVIKDANCSKLRESAFTIVEDTGHTCRVPVWPTLDFWQRLEKTPHDRTRMNCLRELIMHHAGLNPNHACWIGVGIGENPALEVLDLSHNELGEDGIAHIAYGLQSNTHLRKLQLNNVQRFKEFNLYSGLLELFRAKPMHLSCLEIWDNSLKRPIVFGELVKWLKVNPKLQTLHVNLSGITAWGIAQLNGCLKANAALKSLGVQEWPMDADLVAPQLEILYLAKSAQSDVSFNFLEKNPFLTMVTVGNLEIFDGDFKVFETNTRITSLSITHVQSQGNHNMWKSVIEKNKTLTSISFGGCLWGEEMAVVEALRLNQTLKHLDLNDGVVNKGRDYDSRIPKLLSEINPSIVSINISHCEIGDEGARWIASWLAHNRTLTHLNMSDCNILSGGARFIADALLRENARLVKLDIGRNQIEDVGAQCLAEVLVHNSTLSWLNISRNRITTVGAHAIAASLRVNETLTHLDMCQNGVESEPLLSMLYDNTALLQLYYENGNSPELNNLLERNFNMRYVAKRAALSFLACHKFYRIDMHLRSLHRDTVVVIAKMIWSTRKDKAWLELALRSTP